MTIPESQESASSRWRKSSYSGSGNACVEVAQAGAVYAVRDSKNPGAGHLTFGTSAFHALVTDIKRGKYDQ